MRLLGVSRMSRLNRAIAFRENVLDRLTTLQTERHGLLNRIDALQSKLAVTHWGDDDSGHQYHVGDQRRYLLKIYQCIKAHTKALTRSPKDDEYWQEVAE